MILYNIRLLPELSGGISAEHGYLEIQAGKIKMVSAAKLTVIPANAINYHGMTLLPGFFDLHTHLDLLSFSTDCQGEPFEMLVKSAKQANRYLEHGFTTVRICGSQYRISQYVKEMVEQGSINGPRILSAGKILGTSAKEKNSGIDELDYFQDGPWAFVRAARKEFAYGADFIKIYASGSAFKTGIPLNPIMTKEEISAAVKTANEANSYVAAHAHADQPIRDCIECGVRTIEHGTYMSQAMLNLLMRTPDCFWIPTLSAMFVSQTEPNERQFWLNRLQPMLEQTSNILNQAYEAGAMLGFGTDSAPNGKQYASGIEFQYRQKYAKMKNIDILLQATKNSAAIVGFAGEKGELKVSYDADLVLIDGNPAENLSVLSHQPKSVWKGGKLVYSNW